MPNYNAPVEDMLFLYDKLRDNKNYKEIDRYKEVTTDLVKDILEEAAKINQNLILPLAKAGDENPAVLENGVPGLELGAQENVGLGFVAVDQGHLRRVGRVRQHRLQRLPTAETRR